MSRISPTGKHLRPVEKIDALLDLPSLRTAGRFPRNPATREIFEELERRGVQVN